MTTGPSSSVTQDDKLWAALSWVFTPIVPIIVLLMEDKKKRPFIKSNAAVALAWAVVIIILSFILTAVTLGFFACLWWVLWIPQLYWAYVAYQGKTVNIPVLSDFVKKQGWA